MRSVALEAAAAGVTVNVIGSGFVDTSMIDAFRKGLALYVEGGAGESRAFRLFSDSGGFTTVVELHYPIDLIGK